MARVYLGSEKDRERRRALLEEIAATVQGRLVGQRGPTWYRILPEIADAYERRPQHTIALLSGIINAADESACPTCGKKEMNDETRKSNTARH